VTDGIFTAAELADILAYNHPKYVWAAVHDVYDFGLIFLSLRYLVRPLYGWSVRAAAAAERKLAGIWGLPVLRALPKAMDLLWKGQGWGAALIFAVAHYLIAIAISVPITVYFQRHEWQFGLSNYTVAGLLWDEGKDLALRATCWALLAVGLYGLARRMSRWWLVLGGVTAVLMLFSSALDPYRARVYFDQERLPAGELRQRLDAMMKRAGIAYSDILVEQSSRATNKIDAYFAGQGPTRTIVLNDVLVRELPAGEIVAAVAHEAGHVSEAKWPNRIAAALAMVAFLYFAERVLRAAARRRWWGISERADVRTLPLISVALFAALTLTAPLTGYLSRERERAADRFALALTRDPASFRSLMVRACRLNKMDPDPPAWVVLRSWTHPPAGERIRLADEYLQNGMSAGGPL